MTVLLYRQKTFKRTTPGWVGQLMQLHSISQGREAPCSKCRRAAAQRERWKILHSDVNYRKMYRCATGKTTLRTFPSERADVWSFWLRRYLMKREKTSCVIINPLICERSTLNSIYSVTDPQFPYWFTMFLYMARRVPLQLGPNWPYWM